jgi:hypothetical protein
MAKLSKRTRLLTKTLEALSDEIKLIAGLDPMTYRNLTDNPPGKNETMAHIGIGPTNLDTVVRSWINRDFRKPRGKTQLATGTIKSSTKSSKRVELSG